MFYQIGVFILAVFLWAAAGFPVYADSSADTGTNQTELNSTPAPSGAESEPGDTGIIIVESIPGQSVSVPATYSESQTGYNSSIAVPVIAAVIFVLGGTALVVVVIRSRKK